MAKFKINKTNSTQKLVTAATPNSSSDIEGHQNNKNEINFIKGENKTKQRWIIATMIGVPLILLAGLLINFFAFYPNVIKDNGQKQGAFHIGDSSATITTFVVVILLCAIVMFMLWYVVAHTKKDLVFDNKRKEWTMAPIGATGMFFDTIGVGSFAIVIGLSKTTKTITDDRKIPGTLTVGLMLPELSESAMLIGALNIDWITLLSMCAIAIVGSVIGAWFASRLNSQILRAIMASLMFIFALLMILVHPQVAVINTASQAVALRGWRLAVGLIMYFFLGALQSLGLGIYAPSMALLTLLGLGTTSILALMSIATSLVMPLSAIKFIKDKNYLPSMSIILTVMGMVGVMISFLVFFMGAQIGGGMDTQTFGNVIRWIAVPVVFYCSGLMFFDFFKDYKKTGWKQPADKDVM